LRKSGKEVAEEEFDELLDTPEFPGFHGAAKFHWWPEVLIGLFAGWALVILIGYTTLSVYDYEIYSASSIAERKDALQEAQEVSRVAVLARDNALSRLRDANAKIADLEVAAAAANSAPTPAVAPISVAPRTLGRSNPWK